MVSVLEDSGDDAADAAAELESFIRTAQQESAHSCAVNWHFFCENDNAVALENAAFHWAKHLADGSSGWYLGLAMSPLARETGEYPPSVPAASRNRAMVPHVKRGYKYLYPLLCSLQAGTHEQSLIRRLTFACGWAKRGNIADDSRGYTPGTISFVYIAIIVLRSASVLSMYISQDLFTVARRSRLVLVIIMVGRSSF